MIVSAFLSPNEIDSDCLYGSWVVVIDVLRATSTIVAALYNGAARIQPVASVNEARGLANRKEKTNILLGGEEKGFRIKGFDLGNSPLEYSAEMVKDKTIIFKTTNGTGTFLGVKSAEKILFGSFLNAKALSRFLSKHRPDHLFFANSGLNGHFSLEDAVCSGYIINQLSQFQFGNDEATACSVLAEKLSNDIPELFNQTKHGRYLKSHAFDADLEYCSRKDILDVIPVFDPEQEGIVGLNENQF